MFTYQVPQKTFKIGDISLGGEPGVTPTVLVGSIFYKGDKNVKDASSGKVDWQIVESTLHMLEEISEKTGIPSMLDVIADSPDAIQTYTRLLPDLTDIPLLIDGSGSSQVNLAGIETASEIGLLDKVILNSLTPDTSEDIYTKLQELGLRNALILAFSTAAVTSASKRVELADQIMKKALAAGIGNLMIDTGVIDLLTLGLACKAQQLIKSQYGYPVGCGTHNAISTWNGLVPKFGVEAKKHAIVGSSLMAVSLGADFALYGPVEHAKIIYPSVAMVDVALSGVLMETRTPVDNQHPRYKIA